MEFSEFLLLFSFLPWLLSYKVVTLRNMSEFNYQFITFKWLKKDFFRFETFYKLVLFLIFILFMRYEEVFITTILFVTISIDTWLAMVSSSKKRHKNSFSVINLYINLTVLFFTILPFLLNYFYDNVMYLQLYLTVILLFNNYLVIGANKLIGMFYDIKGSKK